MIQANVAIVGGRPGTTYEDDSTDASQALAAAKLATAGSHPKKCNAVMITIENNGIRYAFGTDPTTSFGHLAEDGAIIKLNSWKSAKDFRFISSVAGNHAKMFITVGW